MSANPTNASLRSSREVLGANSTSPQIAQPPAYYAPGREALQALLAFSSLHAQIRQRRARLIRENSRPDSVDVWGPEQFVLDEVLQLVSERALAITGTDGVAIALAEGDEIRCRAAAGSIAPDVGARLDPSSGFSGACLRTGLIVRCDDSEKDPRVDRNACRRMGLRSIVAVPLMSERGVIGLLEAFCSEPFGFNDSDVRSLSLLAELILAALKPEEETSAEDSPAPRIPEPPAGDAQRTILQPAHAPKVEPPKIEAATGESPANKLELPQAAEGANLQNSAQPARADEKAHDLPNVQSLRDALARVTEESSHVRAPEPGDFPQVLPAFSQSVESQNSRHGLVIAIVVLLLLLVLGLVGGTFWWRQARHNQPAGVASAPQQIAPSAMQNANDSAAPPEASEGAIPPDQKESAKESSPQITGVRHWSSSDSSTVAIDLQSQVQYEAHRLTDPERIYFDLHDTTLAAGLPGSIEVGDAVLVRIRIAQPSPDVTRVVLETKDSPNFSVSMETKPYRLVVEIRSLAAKPKSAKLDLFAAPAEMSQQRAAVAPAAGTWLQPPAPESTENQPARASAAKFRIVLDAGHGGWDMGTVGRKGLMEKNLVLDIVARVGSLVSSRLGADVIYTRHDDTYVALEQRTETANLAQADMFLSVHGNYSDLPSARGVETYYTNTYSSVHARTHDGEAGQEFNVALTNVDVREKVLQSRIFAERVQQALFHTLLMKDPAVRDRGVRKASYVVLTGTTMPAILTEVSFVSSPTDEARMEDPAYRQQIAEAIYKGIAAYAESAHRVNMASTSQRPSGQ